MKMRVRVTGGKEIQRKLEMLPREVVGQPMREIVMMGGNIVKDEAIANARAIGETGTLASDIHAELDARESVGTKVAAKIGPGSKGWYGRLVEYGHKIKRVTGRTKKGRRIYLIKETLGEVPPHPWLRPALDAKKQEARDAMTAELDRRLKRIWKRR